MNARPQTLDQFPTPSLVVERGGFDANVGTMSAARPGPSLRPHVKAFKSTAIARILSDGHENFCAAPSGRAGRDVLEQLHRPGSRSRRMTAAHPSQGA